MKELPPPEQLAELDKNELIKLIQVLWEDVQKLKEKQPKRTSKNSSLPPAKGFKPAVKKGTDSSPMKRIASLGRAGGGRPLSDNPDQVLEARLKSCNKCGLDLPESLQKLVQRYDKIDIPPICPVVTQVKLYGCTCPDCGEVQIAPVAAGLEPGTPYQDGVVALVTALRYEHAIGYERLSRRIRPNINIGKTLTAVWSFC
jgi:transposase